MNQAIEMRHAPEDVLIRCVADLPDWIESIPRENRDVAEIYGQITLLPEFRQIQAAQKDRTQRAREIVCEAIDRIDSEVKVAGGLPVKHEDRQRVVAVLGALNRFLRNTADVSIVAASNKFYGERGDTIAALTGDTSHMRPITEKDGRGLPMPDYGWIRGQNGDCHWKESQAREFNRSTCARAIAGTFCSEVLGQLKWLPIKPEDLPECVRLVSKLFDHVHSNMASRIRAADQADGSKVYRIVFQKMEWGGNAWWERDAAGRWVVKHTDPPNVEHPTDVFAVDEFFSRT